MKRHLTFCLALTLCLALAAPAGAVEYTVAEVIPCQYDEVYEFSEGLALTRVDGRWSYIDQVGKTVTDCGYDYKYCFSFSEGLAVVCRDDGMYGKWGYIDKTGQEVIPCRYDVAQPFSEGLARVQSDWKEGFVDRTGKEVVPCQYSQAWDFSEGLAPVYLGERWGYIDQTGTVVLTCGDRISPGSFSEGLAVVEYNGDRKGYIDKTGEVVIPIVYKGAVDFSEGLARAWDGKFHSLDQTGAEVWPCPYGNIWDFSEGLALVWEWQNNKWGFVDKAGNEVIPCKYDRAESFSEGLAAVSLGGKYGYIDKMDREIVPFRYDNARPCSEGLAAVELDGKWGYISITAFGTAYPSAQTVDVDGRAVEFQCYALKDENGFDTNYIKLRDLADILNGSAAQFEVGWNGNITITTAQSYTKNGSEQNTPFSGQREYEKAAVKTLVNGVGTTLDAFQLKDDNGGGYTYYKLRDLGAALGFTVDWSGERGIFIETN